MASPNPYQKEVSKVKLEGVLNTHLQSLNPFQAQNLKLFLQGLSLSRSPLISELSSFLPQGEKGLLRPKEDVEVHLLPLLPLPSHPRFHPTLYPP